MFGGPCYIDGALRPLRLLTVGLALSLAGCPAPRSAPPPPLPPRALLLEKTVGPRPPVDRVSVGDDTRDGLLASATWEIPFPAEPRLTFALGSSWAGQGEAPGWGRFVVTLDGREIARATVNPRAAHDWKEFSLDVPAPVSGTGRIEFMVRYTDKDGRDLEQPPELALAVAEPVIHDRRSYGRGRGVVLISIDTLRRDHVGFYGYPKPTTPTLDALAGRGIAAEDAVSVSSWTLPSHLSMLTSALPGVHGGTDMKKAFNHSVPTLARVLSDRGFATHAVTSHLYVSRTYGLDEGFDSMNFRQDRSASQVVDQAAALLDRFGDRDFFLFLHFYDPHWHYAPPESALRHFENGYTGSMGGNLKDFQSLRPDQVSAKDLAHLLALYDGEIRYTDDEVGRLMGRLKERGLADGTLVLVTSDHGEEFLDHGSWEHQKTLYEEVVRIPLLVAGPGIAPRREGKPVDLLDVAPTILDFLRLPVPPTMKGRSLLKPLSEVREMYAETDHTTDGSRLAFLRAGSASWKALIRFDQVSERARASEWYDLASDPGEKSNRPPADAVRAAIEARVREGAFKSRSGSPSTIAELSAEQKEKLRALGYVGR